MATDDLTGVWIADNGASYYIRQIGNDIWWVGMNGARDGIFGDFSTLVNCIHPGTDFTNVFRGRLTPTGIEGAWADVPRGRNRLSGTLTLGSIIEVGEPAISISTDMKPPNGNGERNGPPPKPRIELFKRAETGGPFGSSQWRRATFVSAPLDIASRFEQTQRNDGHNMHHHLKMYRDYAVAFGKAAPVDPVNQTVEINFPPAKGIPTVGPFGFVGAPYTFPNASRDYSSFINAPWWPAGAGDPLDGDINFDVELTYPIEQPNFLTESGVQWFNSPDDIAAKLNYGFPVYWKVHAEIIMYGRETATTAPLLPGWMESGGNSVLLNGRPIEGAVPGNVVFGSPTLLLGQKIVGSNVRVTGFLVLDCHWDTGTLSIECYNDKPEIHNVELHPVYAIDILQDFTQPRLFPTLNGVWHANDMGTYYIRQIGNILWWLGLSRDQGQTYANVFQGTMQGSAITGQWVDVPVSDTGNRGNGTLSLNAGGASSIELTLTSQTGGFGPSHWRKLYDVLDVDDIPTAPGGPLTQ
jgi:hypothetical protein